MKHKYKIDSDEIETILQPDEYSLGSFETLSSRFDDLSQNKKWFSEGFVKEKSLSFFDISKLYNATEHAIKKIISDLDSSIDLTNFQLETYHKFVDDDLHLSVIQKTRRLFPRDLDIDTDKIVQKFSEYFETKLTFKNPISGDVQWMIARINRPYSNDFNTAHKDIYEVFDKFRSVPQMINVWIPLCGVTHRNTLPIVPGSHLLPENKILRTKAGSTINGIHYSVNSIKNWDEDSTLKRIPLQQDEILIFSSHLIHGLAFNHEKNVTRTSFEFRLYAEDQF